MIIKINQHSFLALYSSNIFYLGLFFVYTIKYWFMKSEIKHQMKKNVKGMYFIFTSLELKSESFNFNEYLHNGLSFIVNLSHQCTRPVLFRIIIALLYASL